MNEDDSGMADYEEFFYGPYEEEIMPLPWKPKSKELLQSWIDAIVDEASDDLTSWETNFLDSISGQLQARGQLSQKQEEVLERIYVEKTK